VTTARISRIIGLLAEIADYVMIDTAGRFDEAVLTAIDRSDEVLAVATMEVPSIKNTKVSLEKLKQLGYRNGGSISC
jgi:pilus assembly protein CpaE